MKYFFLLLILIICGLAYVRCENPKLWNNIFAAVKAPEEDSATPTVAAEPTNTSPITPIVATAPTNSASSTPTNTSSTNAPSTNIVDNSPKEWVAPDPIPAQQNWTWTVLYKEYHNVVVTQVESDKVHIRFDGGIGSLNMADLPPELQKMFNYDPQAAALAAKQNAEAQAKIDAEEAPKIASEIQREKAQADADTQNREANNSVESLSLQIQSLQTQASNIQYQIKQDSIQGYDSRRRTTYGNSGTYWSDKIESERAELGNIESKLGSAKQQLQRLTSGNTQPTQRSLANIQPQGQPQYQPQRTQPQVQQQYQPQVQQQVQPQGQPVSSTTTTIVTTTTTTRQVIVQPQTNQVTSTPPGAH